MGSESSDPQPESGLTAGTDDDGDGSPVPSVAPGAGTVRSGADGAEVSGVACHAGLGEGFPDSLGASSCAVACSSAGIAPTLLVEPTCHTPGACSTARDQGSSTVDSGTPADAAEPAVAWAGPAVAGADETAGPSDCPDPSVEIEEPAGIPAAAGAELLRTGVDGIQSMGGSSSSGGASSSRGGPQSSSE